LNSASLLVLVVIDSIIYESHAKWRKKLPRLDIGSAVTAEKIDFVENVIVMLE